MELKPLPGSIEAMGRGQNMDLVYENSREEGRRVVNLYVNLHTKLIDWSLNSEELHTAQG